MVTQRRLAETNGLARRGGRSRTPDGGWQHCPRSSAGCRKKTAQAAEAMGKSRGGLSTKIHATVDALGNPLRLLLTPGQASEYEQAAALIDGFTCEAVLVDKGYDLRRLRRCDPVHGS